MTRRVALFGGTFNPIHLGHLFAAERIREAERFDRVVFIPSRVPPHRKAVDLAPARDRLAMARQAIRGNPAFQVSDVEIRREGPSYTVDTLRHFHESLGPRARLSFLLGFDAALELGAWKELPEILALADLVVASRPGTKWNASTRARWKRVPRVEGAAGARRIRLVAIPALPISATEIRQRLREGRSIRYLVPEVVERYLRRHRLYAR